MDFSLTEDQKMFRRMVRDFVIKEVAPLSGHIDRSEEYPAETINKMAELGLFGMSFPEEYGGSGGDSIHLVIAVEEVARICASTALIYLVSLSAACYSVYKFGSEEQKRRFVVPHCKEGRLMAFALTEPAAGSDATALETTATRKGDGYVLNGTKLFVTNGAEAEAVVTLATIDKSLRHWGMVAFIVEKGTPGFSVGKKERMMGMRGSSTTGLIYKDCYVPLENRLGEERQGFEVAMGTLDNSRIYIAAQAVGIAQGALDLSLSYAKERQQFGQPIANFQAIQWMLSDMATQIEAARLLIYYAAYLKDQGFPFIKEGSMAKLYASEVAMAATTKAIQIFGGYGYTKDYPVERMFRNAKATEIYEETSEIQRRTIATWLLGQIRWNPEGQNLLRRDLWTLN